MLYLTAQKIVHRDLAARNILLGRENTAKVADFGMSRESELEDNLYMSSDQKFTFPVRWASPEVMSRKQSSEKSDVWAFGVTLFEILTDGETPYKMMSNAEVIKFVSVDLGRLPQPPGCPDWLYEIMSLLAPFPRSASHL